MGLLSGILGNASEVDAPELEAELSQVLAAEEQIDKAYRLIRDLIVFTNRRLLLIDRQGVTGRKSEYHSIPYRAITHFSIETAGRWDLEAELKIWVSGTPTPIQRTFKKGASIMEVQRVLAMYVMR